MNNERMAIVGMPNLSSLISLAMIAGNFGGSIVLAQSERPTEEFIEKLKEQAEREQRDLESAAAGFKKLTEMCSSNGEWLEPPTKKFRGAKGYLNGQNLPFYMKF